MKTFRLAFTAPANRTRRGLAAGSPLCAAEIAQRSELMTLSIQGLGQVILGERKA